MNSYTNPTPIIDLVAIYNQIKKNTDYFQNITVSASTKKLIDQYSPDLSTLPACGISCEFMSASEAVGNSTRVQVLDITICCTIILPANNDLTGAGSQINFFDEAFRELMKCLYCWKPATGRYTNCFSFDRSERIENSSSNAYEVYCVYFTIPAQIDYLDGYITSGQQLSLISSEVITEKNKTTNHINIQNNL